MRKVAYLGMALCLALAVSSCKSSQSAYKKAYEKAQQQELAETSATTAPVQVEQAVVSAPATQTAAPVGVVRQEKVTLVSGDGLKAYSVVCGSFGVKANAEGLRSTLMGEGYAPLVVFNAEKDMYRVVVSTFDDRQSAANARDAFKAKYAGNQDFQAAWLLYNAD